MYDILCCSLQRGTVTEKQNKTHGELVLWSVIYVIGSTCFTEVCATIKLYF